MTFFIFLKVLLMVINVRKIKYCSYLLTQNIPQEIIMALFGMTKNLTSNGKSKIQYYRIKIKI